MEQAILRNREVGLERTDGLVREKALGTTKLTTYVTEMNPDLRVHPVYATKKFIPDYKREVLARLRLMSHNLRIEVGRWSRTPAEQRVCQCDGARIQTERHVLIYCSLTERLRDDYPQLLSEETYWEELCNYAYAVLEKYT